MRREPATVPGDRPAHELPVAEAQCAAIRPGSDQQAPMLGAHEVGAGIAEQEPYEARQVRRRRIGTEGGRHCFGIVVFPQAPLADSPADAGKRSGLVRDDPSARGIARRDARHRPRGPRRR